MFEFLNDLGNYETRRIGRHDAEWGFISTARVSDGRQPYETAVCHARYRDAGKMVIVEAYDTSADAEAGHARWVAAMTSETLPASLTDCLNGEIGQLAYGDEPPTYALRAAAETAR
jgi:hypothetical protein